MGPQIDPSTRSATESADLGDVPLLLPDHLASVSNTDPSAALEAAVDDSERLRDLQKPVDGPTRLFVKGAGDAAAIDANDVRQGQLGDCYLLGSLGALAKEDPRVIRDMVHENKDAVGNVTSYAVDLYQRRPPLDQLAKVSVTVSAKELSNAAARFGDTDAAGNHEVWVKVIEKAYAQLNGGYSKIAGGHPAAAMEALTGLPATERWASGYSFDQLQRDLAAGRPVCLTTVPAGDTGPSFDKLKLRASHCYTVIDCKLESGQPMVRLANPWGDRHPGVRSDGWLPYAEVTNGHSFAGVDVGADKSSIILRDTIDAARAFWKA